MPVLGICRGMQMLNLARGGSLVQDLAAMRGLLRAFVAAAERWGSRSGTPLRGEVAAAG